MRVPPNRYGPLKTNWMKVFTPIVKNLGLQIRFNTRAKCVELRNSDESGDVANLQKGADFVKAFILGFDVDVSGCRWSANIAPFAGRTGARAPRRPVHRNIRGH